MMEGMAEELRSDADWIDANLPNYDNSDLCRRAAARVEELEAALDLALGYLVQSEPGDSRAVSNEFVAMASVLANINDSRSQECLDIISAASAELKEKSIASQ